MTQHSDSSHDGATGTSAIHLRPPTAKDGVDVWDLVAACPPLDKNSVYCNLLQCTDFADTCVAADRDGTLVGWISGYRPLREPETLFIWQVAVHDSARGEGLAGRMLRSLVRRSACAGVRRLKTTITPDNDGSHALFRSFAKRVDAPISESDGFDERDHFRGLHDSERLITIGPIPDRATDSSTPLSAA